MDAMQYITLKAKGLATVVKINSAYAVLTTQFSVDGTQAAPHSEAIDLATVAAQRANLVAQIAALDTLATDMGAAK